MGDSRQSLGRGRRGRWGLAGVLLLVQACVTVAPIPTAREACEERVRKLGPDERPEVSLDPEDAARRQARLFDGSLLLSQLPAGDVEHRAELAIALAGLSLDEAQYVARTREWPPHAAAISRRDECFRTGRRDGEPAGAFDRRESDRYVERAFTLYRSLLDARFESAVCRDEVHWILAERGHDHAASSGEDKCRGPRVVEAIAHYRALIEEVPKSPLVGDAWARIGNFAFDCNDSENARAAYGACARLRGARNESLCLYQLAWLDVNAGHHAQAMSRFAEVVALSGPTNRSGLREEALNDVRVPMRALGLVDEAVAWFRDRVGEQEARVWTAKLAGAYASNRGEDGTRAIRLLRSLLDGPALDLGAPRWRAALVELLHREPATSASAADELRALVRESEPGSAWAKAQRNEVRVTANLDVVMESLFTFVALERTRGGWASVREFGAAYLALDPPRERAGEVRAWLAETPAK